MSGEDNNKVRLRTKDKLRFCDQLFPIHPGHSQVWNVNQLVDFVLHRLGLSAVNLHRNVPTRFTGGEKQRGRSSLNR